MYLLLVLMILATPVFAQSLEKIDDFTYKETVTSITNQTLDDLNSECNYKTSELSALERDAQYIGEKISNKQVEIIDCQQKVHDVKSIGIKTKGK